MSAARWEGTATALTSLTQGGETLGTITYLRREAFLTPQGRLNIPVVSGNAVRGALRDTGAHLLWDALAQPRLTLPVAHALWSGGALVKAKTQPLTGRRLADLRRMVPHLGVFGAAGGGRIIDGSLLVGKLVPLCAQTAHVLPEHLRTGDLPDIHDLLQIERYSRIPDTHRFGDAVPAEAHDDTDADDPLMRYGVETFIPGTRFHTLFALGHVTATEHAYFTEVLHHWLPTAAVGGKTGRGHGRLAFDLTYTGAPVPAVNWRGFGGADPAEVTAALTWLD